jgi:hypothetical protein
MKIDHVNGKIAGLPVKAARDLMRRLRVRGADRDTILEFLNREYWRQTVDAARKANSRIPFEIRNCDHDWQRISKIWRFKFSPIDAADAHRVFAALLAEGYIEPRDQKQEFDDRKYQASEKGVRLASTNLTKRFDRDKADSEVAAVITRANEINRRDELVFFVHKITVFGSYLTDSNDLGDIDLVVELARRRKHDVEESHYRADNSGKTLHFIKRLFYAENEVLQLLRARRARLSLNDTSAFELETKFRVLFEWLPDVKRRAEMEAFDWRLHEPTRQVKEWLASNPGLNTDPVEIARWCQEVADLLSHGNWQSRLFYHWANNAAHDLLVYWGVPATQAAAELAHRRLWDDYRRRVSDDLVKDYKRPLTASIEAEIYAHFTKNTENMDAAILIAKRHRWKPQTDFW